MFSKFSPEDLFGTEGSLFCALVSTSVLKYVWLRLARASRDQLFTLVGHVSELTVYPIKACGGVDLQSALATDVGLCGDGYYDRRWMIQTMESERTDKRVNMRICPRLTLVTCTVDGDWLVVSAPDMTPLRLPRRLPRHPDTAKFRHAIVKNSLDGTDIKALDAGDDVSDWMTRFMCQPVRVFHSGPGIGLRDAYDQGFSWENSARKGDKKVFSHLTSYLLCTTASLADLNGRLDSPVAIRNFRPNIVVDNSIAFDEDNWEEIRIGSATKFHYVQPCRRCVITTVDPETGKHISGGEPLKTLNKYRQRAPYGHSPLFGAYIAMDCQGSIRVGDPVYAIRRQQAAF